MTLEWVRAGPSYFWSRDLSSANALRQARDARQATNFWPSGELLSPAQAVERSNGAMGLALLPAFHAICRGLTEPSCHAHRLRRLAVGAVVLRSRTGRDRGPLSSAEDSVDHDARPSQLGSEKGVRAPSSSLCMRSSVDMAARVSSALPARVEVVRRTRRARHRGR